jgi:hypothetical protein
MTHIKSRFVYERSLQRDVAHVLGNIRAHVPQSHYFTVDRIIRELVDLFHEVDPVFDIDDFCRRANAHRDLPRIEVGASPTTDTTRRQTHG